MSIFLLLFFCNFQSLEPAAYLPWPGLDCVWPAIRLPMWYVQIFVPAWYYTLDTVGLPTLPHPAVVLCWDFSHCYCLYYAHHYCSVPCMGYKTCYSSLLCQCPRNWQVSAYWLFASWSLRYCSTVTDVCLMCFMFCMITLPIFIPHTWYHCCLQWSYQVSRGPSPEENKVEYLQVSLFIVYASFLDFRDLSYSSSLLMFPGSLPIFGNSTLMGLWYGIMAGLGNPVLTVLDLIWNKGRWAPLLVCLHFFMVHFINMTHASTWPLLWWWYDDVTTWSMFKYLQNL